MSINRNPILRATVTVFGFWWLVLTAYMLLSSPWSERTLDDLADAALLSLGVMLLGFILGFFGRLALIGGRSMVAEKMLLAGGQDGDAISRLGPLPKADPVPMGKLPPDLEEIAAWLRPMKKRFPAHAKAAEAVIRVMMSFPSLPASPVPGGHGGRTLLQHSLGVVQTMIEEAPDWVYRGQFKRDRKTLAVPPRNGPHRFTASDFGLLILTALAHDIGKIACYRLLPNGQVEEVKPNHDIEGARLLRRIPEVMSLSFDDRRALLTACAYYHHPYAMPMANWCDDRIRSLTELLIHVDNLTGKKEGHVLTEAEAGDFGDEDEGAVVVDRRLAAELGAAINIAPEYYQRDSIGDYVEQDATLDAGHTPETVVTDSHDPDDPTPLKDRVLKSGNPDLVGFYRFLHEKRSLINGSNVGGRIAFKAGEWLYICDSRYRREVFASSWQTGLSHSELTAPPSGRSSNALTIRLLESLSEAGLLLQEIPHPDGHLARFSAISSVWKIATKASKSKAPVEIASPFFAVRAAAFGLEDEPDWEWPITIVKPFWGWQSETGKLRHAPAQESVSAPANAGEDVLLAEDAPLEILASQEDGSEEIPSVLTLIEEALFRAGVQPERRAADGRRIYYADGPAGSIIDEVLAAHLADEEALGISRAKAGSGRDLICLPPTAGSPNAR